MTKAQNAYMEENDQELVAQENDTETTEEQSEVAEETTEAPAEPSVEDRMAELEKKLATAEAQKDHWRSKAKEKSKETVLLKEEVKQTPKEMADLLAISRANIHEDDVERLERYAKAEKMSIREALKDPEWQAIHALRVEQRNTAGASNVSKVGRSPAKVTDEVLLANASMGKIPDSDYDIQRLIAAKAKALKG